jgi:hypothetical protein
MPQHFEGLQERLLRAGIAPRHVRRYARELEDHFSDLIAMQKERGYDEPDASLRARALLGDDDELAEAMLATKQFRSLTARAPWLVFGILPPLMILVLLLVVGLGMAAVSIPLHGPGTPLPSWCVPAASAICLASNYAIGPLAALLVLVTAWRQRFSGRWPLLGVMAAALFGAITTLSIVMPYGIHKGEVSVGMGVAIPAIFQSLRFVFAAATVAGASLLLWPRRSAR